MYGSEHNMSLLINMNKIVLLVLFKKQIQKPKTFLLFIYLTFDSRNVLTTDTFKRPLSKPTPRRVLTCPKVFKTTQPPDNDFMTAYLEFNFAAAVLSPWGRSPPFPNREKTPLFPHFRDIKMFSA